ncbi:MAG: DnaJ domain-containing protein [Phycisphaeraceae bacterium]|nr:DnaJ domain-containing protein [Phycisphaeraceae bacterium]
MRWIKNKLKRAKVEAPAPERPRVSRSGKRYDTRLTDSVLGSVVDLSIDGARVVTRSEPSVRAGHVFEIAIACDGARVFVLSRVAWTRKIDKDLWNIGLHFFDADSRTRTDLERLLDRCASGREMLPTSMEVEDLYAVLGVPREATLEQIRAAYRRLARQFHPDHSPDEDSSRRFARISKSYMVLRDESLRRRYDQILTAA